MFFDPRHVGREGCDAKIVNADGRRTDQHDFVLELFRRDQTVEDVRNRIQGERVIRAAIVDEHASELIDRDAGIPHLHRAAEVKRRLFGAQLPVQPRGLQPDGRIIIPLILDSQRLPPEGAVAVGDHVDMRQVFGKGGKPQQRRKDHPGLERSDRAARISEHGEGRRRHEIKFFVSEPRFLIARFGKIEDHGQDHAAAPHDRLLKQVIGLYVFRLREEHVEHDDPRAKLGQPVHDPGPYRPGPGEPAELIDALLIDGRDDRLRARCDGAPDIEPEIERFFLKHFHEPCVHEVHERKHDRHNERNGQPRFFPCRLLHSLSLSATPFPRRSPASRGSGLICQPVPGS